MSKIDVWLLIILILLAVFGLLNLFGINKELFNSQFVFLLVGFAFFVVFNRTNFFLIKNNDKLIFFSGLIILLVSYFFVPEIRGSKRWINLYFFNLQPSEILKPFYIISLAQSLTDKRGNIVSLFLYFLPMVIIFKQPDLGNTIVYFSIFLAMLFFSRRSLKYFFGLIFIILIFIPIFWHFLADYQKNRLLSFINPKMDVENTSYNLNQSIIALGSGRIFGRGLGLGTQSRLAFLPENHTDFVFASFVEQFGFFGGLILIILYFFLVWRLMTKALIYRNDNFLHLFFVGNLFFFLSHIFINIGMNLGILPITGITLPLLSYGGSSILTVMIILGLTSRF